MISAVPRNKKRALADRTTGRLESIGILCAQVPSLQRDLGPDHYMQRILATRGHDANPHAEYLDPHRSAHPLAHAVAEITDS